MELNFEVVVDFKIHKSDINLSPINISIFYKLLANKEVERIAKGSRNFFSEQQEEGFTFN